VCRREWTCEQKPGVEVLQSDASFTQRAFTVVIDQRELGGENVEEFIFLLMPVAQRRERAPLERM
jgi:hypothetical protein